MKNSTKRIYMGVMAMIGWFGILLQLYLMMKNVNNKGFLEKLINFFSYFTILTNIFVAISLTTSLLNNLSGWGKFFSRPFSESALTVYIVIVGVIHYLFLQEVVELRGWNMLADTILHKIMPLLYAAYWIFFVSKGQLRWGNAIRWLIYPLVYFIYVLVRGMIDGFYPYPFANINELGYGKALFNGFLIMISFYISGVILIMVDKSVQRNRAKNSFG